MVLLFLVLQNNLTWMIIYLGDSSFAQHCESFMVLRELSIRTSLHEIWNVFRMSTAWFDLGSLDFVSFR